MGFGPLSPDGFGGLRQPKVCKPATPSPALDRSYHGGIPCQNATVTLTVTLRPIKGAAIWMKEMCT